MGIIAGKPHFERINLMLVPLSVIISMGVIYFGDILTKLKIKRSLYYSIFTLLCLTTLFIVLTDYFFVYTKQANAWDDFYVDTINYLNQIDNNYESVYFRKFTNHPYIYLSFFKPIKYDYFLNNIVRDGFEVTSIGKYHFIDNDINYMYCKWLQENKPKIVFITNEIKYEYKPIYVAKSFNDFHAFVGFYDMEIVDNIARQSDKITCN